MNQLYADCCIDFWKFFSYLKIKDEDLNALVPLERWPVLDNLFYVFEENRFVIIGKPKQTGVSVFVCAYALWKLLTVPYFSLAYISNGKIAGAVWLNEKLMTMYDNLPPELQVPIKIRNRYYIEFEGLQSSVTVWGSTRHPGLGSHYSLIIPDEYDFHRFPADDWAALEATTNMGGRCIIPSTRNKAAGDSKYYKTYVLAKAGENEFVPVFISCFDRPGRDQEWYEATARKFKDEPWRLKESYPRTEEEMLSPIDARAFFNQEENAGITLAQLLDACVPPIEKRMGHIHIYKKHIPGMLYLGSADCAVGQGGDYQSFTLWEKNGNTLDLAVALHSNNIMTITYAQEMIELCTEYGTPVLVVEANSYGEAVLNELERQNYLKIYYRDRKNNKRGYYTGTQRDLILRELSTAFTKGQIASRYRPMIDEMLYFQRTKRGTIECVKGHDDLVMSAAIAWQIGKDLVNQPEGDTETSQLITISSGGMFDV
jgi:hypothetical protein